MVPFSFIFPARNSTKFFEELPMFEPNKAVPVEVIFKIYFYNFQKVILPLEKHFLHSKSYSCFHFENSIGITNIWIPLPPVEECVLLVTAIKLNKFVSEIEIPGGVNFTCLAKGQYSLAILDCSKLRNI